jgi:FHA domain
MATTLTLTTRKELLCVIGVHVNRPLPRVVDEVRALAVETSTSADHLTLVFRDPLDALLGWRHLDRAFGSTAYLMSVVASAAAVEMLNDPSELARESMAELIGSATGEPTEHGLVLVHMDRLVYRPAIAEVERVPGGLALAVFCNGLADRVIQLTQPGWIGRARNAPVRIDSTMISKRQIELGVDSHDGWFARDAHIGSTSGFSIARDRVGETRHTLHPGMALEFGGAAVVVLSS